jgi:hypothetical protein
VSQEDGPKVTPFARFFAFNTDVPTSLPPSKTTKPFAHLCLYLSSPFFTKHLEKSPLPHFMPCPALHFNLVSKAALSN